MSTRKGMADFSELEELANRIGKAVRMADSNYSGATYSNRELLKTGAYKQMEHLIKETPVGTDRSNWYDWTYPSGGGTLGGPHSASYFLAGRTHKAGTLARGWVDDMPEGGSGKPDKSAGKNKVDNTPITKNGDELSMQFYNTAPYAWAIERGHAVRFPYFWYDGVAPGEGPIVGFVPGQWYIRDAVTHAEADVKKAVTKELSKQLKQVVKHK